MKSFPTAILLPGCTGCVVGLWNRWSSLINSTVTGQQRYLILKPSLKKNKKKILFQICFLMKIHIILLQSNICAKRKSLLFYFWNDSKALLPTFTVLYWSACQLQVLCFIFCLVTATLHPSPHATETKATSLDCKEELHRRAPIIYISLHIFFLSKKRSIVSMNMLRTSR